MIIHDYPNIGDGLFMFIFGFTLKSMERLRATACRGNPSWRSRKADALQVQDQCTCYAMLADPLVSCLEAGWITMAANMVQHVGIARMPMVSRFPSFPGED